MYRFFISALIIVSMFAVFLISCDETTTEPGIYSVNLNLTIPADDDVGDVDNHSVTLFLFEDENSSTVIYSGATTINSNGFTIAIDEVDEAEYPRTPTNNEWYI